ncbi:MAG: hypothetical protein Q9M31_09065 [Mariprofundus sp.]|nr:hypothetical protein [Mariprofundus sp.]
MLRPLNTADHFTLMMDHEIRQSGLAGNFCALVFELDSAIDIAWLQMRVTSFISRFPEANVRLKQQGRRFFWKQHEGDVNALFFHHRATDSSSALTVIEAIINRREAAESALPVGFHLVEMETGAYFMLRWFHPICDAKGAELIMHHLLKDEVLSDGENPFNQLKSKWGLWKKIAMGIQAKRHINHLDRIDSSLPKVEPVIADQLKFQIVTLDRDDSKAILLQARKEAGMTGTALYFIGCMMRALQRVGCDEKQGFCVPYAMNMRKRKALFPLLGNQVSFLFAQASLQQVANRALLFSELREQHKTTVRSGLDVALVPLMEAGAWLPLHKYGRIIRKGPKGEERSSFWFSYTGESDPKVEEIADAKVNGMFQLSQVTSPPALGLLVSQYDGCLTLSFNYIGSQIDQQWMEQLIATVQSELTGEVAA